MKSLRLNIDILLTLCVFILLSTTLSASPIIDSLEAKLNTTTIDTQRVILFNHLAWEYKDLDVEQADAYVSDAIKLADQIAYRNGLAIAYKNKGVIALYLGEMEQARQYLHDAILQFEILQDKAQKANTLNNLGMYWQMVGNNQEALAHFELSAAIRESLGNDKWIGNSCNNLGAMYFFMGNYEKALRSHLRALKIWKRLGDQREITSSFLNLGAVYLVMEDDEQALAYFHDGLRSAEVLANHRGMADAYANIGDIWLKRKDYAQSLEYYLHALELREKLSDKPGMIEALGSIGEVYTAQGNYQEAIAYNLKGLHLSQEIGDKNGITYQYNKVGEVLLKQGKADEALTYLFDAIRVAEELILLPELAKAHRLVSKAYVIKKDYPLAFQYQQKYMDVKDQILSEESAKKMIEMKVQYESEAQQKEIDLLKKDNAIFKLERDRYIFISILLLAAVLIGFLFYRYVVQAKTSQVLAQQKREIAERNQALEISNKDLEQFAYVVSHDLKQPLRTISSFSGLIEQRYRTQLDEDGTDFLQYIIGGVDRMNALLSDLLVYSQIGKKGKDIVLDLNQILEITLSNLRPLIEENHALIEADHLPVIIGNQTGMIQVFQNLIGNGIKFHRDLSPHIRIRYEAHADYDKILVEDNGIGIEAKYKHKIFTVFQRLHTESEYPGTGIGLAICQKVVKQHGGELWLDSVPGKGSTFWFTIPRVKQLEEIS